MVFFLGFLVVIMTMVNEHINDGLEAYRKPLRFRLGEILTLNIIKFINISQ